MNSVEKRVLLIANAFPPTGGPGVQRIAKFAKYLPRFGWRPVVWSADYLDALPHDESLGADLPDDLIHHSRPAWSDRAAHRGIMGIVRRLGLKTLTTERTYQAIEWRMLSALRRVSSCVVPDDQVCWALRSLGPLLTLVRREQIDVVFSTFSPPSNHLLGLALQRITGLPWVADFRDLWTDDYAYPRRFGVRRWIEGRVQQAVLRRADVVVAVTPGQARILAGHVPDRQDKFSCIRNGFDEEDFSEQSVEARVSDRFVLAFTGWFLADRAADGLFQGIGRFAQWAKSQPGQFEFRVVGTISDAMTQRFASAGVELAATGYLPHDQTIRHMRAADVLLLPVPSARNGETMMTGKLFEYLASGRPILVVGPQDGEAQRLVHECEAGVCVTPEAETVQRTLTDLWALWRAGQLPRGCGRERLAPYTRLNAAGKLAELLDGLMRGRARTTPAHRAATHGALADGRVLVAIGS